MHEDNCFITLTYSDENLKSDKLVYSDFQKFMKKLRKLQDAPMGVFVTGEYGEKTKRPHWHAIIFNWRPSDAQYHYSNERGDKIYTSETLTRLWGLGLCEFGSVTFESAGYCARYAAKKLVHGNDGEHQFDPISKKSSKHAIGKKWLEKYFWTDCFSKGFLTVDGQRQSIPRYYEKWLKENKPDYWLRYVTEVKPTVTQAAQKKSERVFDEYRKNLESRPWYKPNPLTPNQVRKLITKSRFKQLQDHLKL